MTKSAIKRIHDWYLSAADGQEIQDIFIFIETLAKELYASYEPTKGPHPDFWQRLDNWLNTSLSENDQKLLFRLVPSFLFVGPGEFETLYRIALNTRIGRWLIDDLGIRFDALSGLALQRALRRTWIGPITDSMRINSFYHINNLAGRDMRSDWRTLSETDPKAEWVKAEIAKNGIQRIVLLEDFVGSGSQIEQAVTFAASVSARIPILVVPLICCPEGEHSGRRWERDFSHLTFRPVISLSKNHFLRDLPQADEPPLFGLVRPVVRSTYNLVTTGLSTTDRQKLYGPFGFAGTGGLVVLWTNCPDNTLPLVHQSSPGWSSLFPRAPRL